MNSCNAIPFETRLTALVATIHLNDCSRMKKPAPETGRTYFFSLELYDRIIIQSGEVYHFVAAIYKAIGSQFAFNRIQALPYMTKALLVKDSNPNSL